MGNGNSGLAWKITGIVFAALLSYGAYMYGRLDDRVEQGAYVANLIEKKHAEDMVAIRERMVATESFQREVLRRLERIDQKLP